MVENAVSGILLKQACVIVYIVFPEKVEYVEQSSWALIVVNANNDKTINIIPNAFIIYIFCLFSFS